MTQYIQFDDLPIDVQREILRATHNAELALAEGLAMAELAFRMNVREAKNKRDSAVAHVQSAHRREIVDIDESKREALDTLRGNQDNRYNEE